MSGSTKYSYVVTFWYCEKTVSLGFLEVFMVFTCEKSNSMFCATSNLSCNVGLLLLKFLDVVLLLLLLETFQQDG
jgi:hypothetical protein